MKVHTRPGDLVVDFFAGSGTTGEAAAKHGRPFLLVDSNPEAVRVMARRLRAYRPTLENCDQLDVDSGPAQQSLF